MLGREDKVSQIRLTAVQYVLLGVFLILAFGLWRLQVARNDYYSSLAEQNRIKQIPILAPRGKILDREGRIIVDNYPSFSVLLLRDQKRDLMADADKIAAGLHMPPDELRVRLKHMAAIPGYQPLFLKDDITPDELAFIESHRAELPELETIIVHRRLYPKNGFMAHVIGYVGQVSEDMLNQPQWELYNPGDIVGMSGVEQYYNDILMGTNGYRQVLVNSRGKEVGTLTDVPAIPGKSLKLTIDLDLQIAAEEALEGKQGAIVAMDPRNGEILAMVSRPAFDPNDFAVHITRDEWNKLIQDPGKPLMNKAIQAQLAPGSTFKILMSVAGLQEGIAQHLIVNCQGGGTFYGRFFKCDSKHGRVDITKGIYESCDTYYYTLGEKLGISKIAKYATEFGFGQKTGIDLPQEVSGVMPSEEWKIKNFKQKWYAGETISVSIGQGAVAVTPIQLARAIGAIASDGTLVRPHVAFPEQFPPGFKQVAAYDTKTDIPMNQDTWQTITDAMALVPTIGTAAPAHIHIEGADFAGKTGTAQTISLEARSKMGASSKSKFNDNSWFVGMTPRRNPEIVVAVLTQGGGWGWRSASLAADVIQAYVTKQRRIQTEVAQAKGKPVPPSSPHADVSAVWHDGDAQAPDKLQGGHFVIPVTGSADPMSAAPGVDTAHVSAKAARGAEMGATESHPEMAQPEVAGPTPTQPDPSDLDNAQGQQRPGRKKATEPRFHPGSACRCDTPESSLSRYVSFRDFDWLLLVLVLMICALGVLEIYSATLNTKFAGVHLKQVYWIVGGVALMFMVSLLNYQALLERVPLLYLISIGSLLAVAVFGKKYLGARRWVQLGSFHFQPSEWVKLVLILAMAKYFADTKTECTTQDIIKAGALVGIPMLMVLVQPDLGTALTYLPIAIMGLFLGGMKAKHAAIILLIGALLAPVAWHVLKPYQRDRLTSFMQPEADSQGHGYQVIQSLVAVGSGGIFGKGTAHGSQTQGQFLPVPHTDFIFAAFAEEHGFIGAMGLLLLYFVVLMRLIQNAQTAPDRAGAFVVMGVVAVLAFHVLVNVGMVVGFMPVTGIPLPLMSYGGSSVLFMFLALGIVMNIRMRRFVN